MSREALAWMTERLAGDSGDLNKSLNKGPPGLRIHVGGTAQWRDLQAWPPHDASPGVVPGRRRRTQRRCSRPHRVLVVPVRPRGPDPLGRRPADVPASRATRQRRARGAARRPDFHQRAAGRPRWTCLGAVRAALYLRTSTGLCARLRATLRRRRPKDGRRTSRTASSGSAPGTSAREVIIVPMSATAYQFAPGAQAPVAGQRRRVSRFARNTGTTGSP